MIPSHPLETLPPTKKPVALALGNFDGLHIGHAAVIQNATTAAQQLNGQAWVFTFHPHPRQILDPETAPPLLSTPQQQDRQLAQLGITTAIRQPFNETFRQLTPEQFFQHLQTHIPSLSAISVGTDWSFGRNRAGNAQLLEQYCQEHNIHFTAQPPVEHEQQRVSSTRIRTAISTGNLTQAAAMLGRPFAIQGTVVHGEKIGRQLGYPTANIDPHNECLPPNGVYAAQLQLDGTAYDAAAYIGDRRTIHTNKPTVLEVHLLRQKNIDLYTKEVEITFLETIRGDQKFENTEELKKQIARDLQAIDRALINGIKNA